MDDLRNAAALSDLPYARRYLQRGPWAPPLASSSLIVPRTFQESVLGTGSALRKLAAIHDDFIFLGGAECSERPTLLHADVSRQRRRMWELFYFKVKIVSLPEGGDNLVSIGACLVDLPPEQFYPNTASMYNGVAYENSGRIAYSPAPRPGIWNPPPLSASFCDHAAFQEGDIIGCGFREKGMQLFFTRNGRCIWESVLCVQHVPFWVIPKPIILLHTGKHKDECAVQVNFGKTPFAFDIESYSASIRQTIARWRQAAASLPPELIHRIVLSAIPDFGAMIDQQLVIRHSEIILCQAAITSVSNVCRRWWKTLRRVRFELVSISTTKRLSQFVRMVRDQTTTSRSPLLSSPGPYVNIIELYADAAERIHLLLCSSAAKHMKNVHSLIWNGSDTSFAKGYCFNRLPAIVASRLPALFLQFSLLKTLVLESHRFPSFRTICRLITSLSSLTALRLVDVSWPDVHTNYSPSWTCRPSSLSHTVLEYRHLVEDIEHVVVNSMLFIMEPAKTDHASNPSLDRFSQANARILGNVCTELAVHNGQLKWSMETKEGGGFKVDIAPDAKLDSLSIYRTSENSGNCLRRLCAAEVGSLDLTEPTSVNDKPLRILDTLSELSDAFVVKCKVMVRDQDEADEVWYDVKRYMSQMWSQGVVEVCSKDGVCYTDSTHADEDEIVLFLEEF